MLPLKPFVGDVIRAGAWCSTFAFLFAVAGPARAASRLAWDAPPGCPSAAEVQATFVELAGKAAERADVSARASVRPLGDGLVLELELASPSGRSRLELKAERCETLAEVVALQMALAADAARTLSPRAPHHVPVRPGPGVVGAVGAVTGVLPETTLGLRLLGRISLYPLDVEVGAGYLLARSVHYPAPLSGIGARMDLAFAILRICSPMPEGSVGWNICAGTSLGSLRATGEGIEPSYTTRQFWAAATISPALEWQVTRHIAVHAEVEGGVALARPSVGVRNLETLFTPQRGALSAWLGMRAHFD